MRQRRIRRTEVRPVADDYPAAVAQLPQPSRELRQRVAERQWYHTIELAPGFTTPGFFDHRDVAPQILPRLLNGRRCLDIATFDGFWATEMASRGADEVIAVDVPDPRSWDWPADSEAAVFEALAARKQDGDSFSLVTEALGHDIERIETSVYDLDPAELGQFDFVYMGSLLLHLRDPVRALERVRSVCRGELLVVENVDPVTSLIHPRRPVATFDGIGRPWWWRLNATALVRMVRSAGFDIADKPTKVRFKRGPGRPVPKIRLQSFSTLEGRTELRESLFGDPHLVLHARPRPSAAPLPTSSPNA